MRIDIPGKGVQVYPAGGTFVGVPGEGPVEINTPGIVWLLNDNFTTPLAAGSVNGTNAEPGPGVRNLTDTGNHLSISGGKAVFDGGVPSTAGDPLLYYGPYTRTPGRMGIAKVSAADITGNGPYFGWYIATDTYQPQGGGFQLLTNCNSWVLGISPPAICSAANGIEYTVVIIHRATGHLVFIKGGAFTNFTFLHRSITENTADLYWGITTYSNACNKNYIRIPTALWLPVPLLSTSGTMTWPTTNGLGHAEGVAGGLGSGGSGLTLLDAGTWAADGTYVSNAPVAGVEKVTDPGMDVAGEWTPGTGWDVGVTTPGVATHVSGTASVITNSDADNVIVGGWYKAVSDIVISAGTVNMQVGSTAGPTYASSGTYTALIRAGLATTKVRISCNAAFAGTIDNFSVKPLPISSLITNVQLATTDCLSEAVIHAYTLGSQAGIVQADRSFAAKAAATAAAGQAVISLKEVTGVGGVGLAVTDSVTIAGTTYTIVSVTGGANVAYDDVAKTQTVTLGANLGAEVLADAKIGLDWAAWNGTITYYDGAGNIKLDEVLAGVYTNRGSTAKAFAADTRLVVRKIGTEYRIFAQEALIGSAITTVAAGAMVGKYWGLFSTLAANEITSFVVHDTGNVTNSHAILDKYSRD